MKKEFIITTSRIDLNKPETITFCENLNAKDYYFIPYKIYENLISYLKDNKNDENFIFIIKYLEISKIIINRLNKTTPVKYFTNITKDYKRFIDILIKGTSYRVPFSREEKRAFEYKINKTDDWCFVAIENKNKKLVFKNLLTSDNSCNNDTYIDTLTACTINISQAIQAEIEDSIKKYDKIDFKNFAVRINNDFNFINNRIIKKGKKVDRVFSSLTNISSVSRQYVTYNGKYFHEIDLSNAQCLLLRILAGERGVKLDDSYNELTSNGKFYDEIMKKAKEMGVKEEKVYDKKTGIIETYSFLDKKEVKNLCYRSIFFKTKLENKSNTALIFNELFPETYNFLKSLNKTEKTAYLLQNIEAKAILPILKKNNYGENFKYFTVHDAIYINDESKIEEVKTLITERIIKLSNGTINSVMFGKEKNVKFYETKIEKNDENNKFTIDNNRKKRKILEKHSLRINKFIELYKNGIPRREIIKELGISLSVYKKYLYKYII